MVRKWWVLAAVACGTFMATLDSSIVNIALPTLTTEIGGTLLRTKWVVVIYLLVITCFLLPFGRISDQYGRKKIFQLGFLVFIAGSTLCGLAPNLSFLILARALQGVGAAMLMANSPAILTQSFPPSELGSALGVMAMVVSAGLLAGPSIGGFLISGLGWRSIFLVNVPIAFIGMMLVHRFVAQDTQPGKLEAFDWPGALLQTVFLVSFISLFDSPVISISGESTPLTRALPMIITAIFGLAFILVERQAKAPLFDFELLKIRTFWTANLAGFLIYIAYSAVTVLMPFYLEEIFRLAPDGAGLYMTAIPLTIFIVAPISGRLSDRFGGQELSFAGALVAALALFAMAGSLGGGGLDTQTSRVAVVGALCATGLSIGLFQSPNNNAIMASVPGEKLGVASALLATIRNLGLVTGTGLATALFEWKMKETRDFVSSLHFTHVVAGVVGVGATIAALGKKRGPAWKLAPQAGNHGLETKRT